MTLPATEPLALSWQQLSTLQFLAHHRRDCIMSDCPDCWISVWMLEEKGIPLPERLLLDLRWVEALQMPCGTRMGYRCTAAGEDNYLTFHRHVVTKAGFH